MQRSLIRMQHRLRARFEAKFKSGGGKCRCLNVIAYPIVKRLARIVFSSDVEYRNEKGTIKSDGNDHKLKHFAPDEVVSLETSAAGFYEWSGFEPKLTAFHQAV